MNYYEILGIQRNATRGEIRTAYLRLVQVAHPDRNVGDPNFSERDERFKRIHEAYEVLHDAERRRHYDRHRWIPSAGSAGKAVVTPVHHGRHDLPSEWLQRASAGVTKEKSNVHLYRNLVLAVLVVLVCVGFQESRRYRLEQLQTAALTESPAAEHSSLAPGDAPRLQSVSRKSLSHAGVKAVTTGDRAETRSPKPSSRESFPDGGSQSSPKSTDRREKPDAIVVRRVAWDDPAQTPWDRWDSFIPQVPDPESPFLGIPPSNANFELGELRIATSDEILQALPFEDVIPFSSIPQFPRPETQVDENAATEFQKMNAFTPVRKSRPRKSSASLQASRISENPAVHAQPWNRQPSPPLDTRLIELPRPRLEFMPPEFDRPASALEIRVPSGFPAAQAVLSQHREASWYFGVQEKPQVQIFDMSLPNSESLPSSIDQHAVSRSSFDSFAPPSLGLPTWNEVTPDQ